MGYIRTVTGNRVRAGVRWLIVGTGQGVTMELTELTGNARSLAALASEATITVGGQISEHQLLLWLAQGWRKFAHECNVYQAVYELPLEYGVDSYDLPTDIKELLEPQLGVALGYTPKTVQTVVRASNVVTVTTSTAHNLGAGFTVDIDGCTDDSFDDSYVVLTVPTSTSFTAAQTGANGSSSGGSLTANADVRRALSLVRPEYLAKTTMAPTPGAPVQYALHVGSQIQLDPPPDYSYPTVLLTYYAEAPGTLDSEDPLPVPAYVEEGLIGAALEKAGKLLGNDRMMALGMKDYKDAVATYRAGQRKARLIGEETA